MHAIDKARLPAFRDAIVADESGSALETMLAQIERAGPYVIGGEARKTVPRGYDASHPRARLLRYEGLSASLEGPIPPEASSGRSSTTAWRTSAT